MARPKKVDPAAPSAPAVAPAMLQVSVDDFVRTRDSVVTGLATLQSAVQDLSRAYILHTNSFLGRAPGSAGDLLTLSNPLGENPLLAGQVAGAAAQRPASPAARSETGDVKQRKKKRAHDPNAPKRPLTPFFLYMQTARPVIASDLGEGTKKGDVSTEGTRRWQEMPEDQKQLWKDAYAKNLQDYQDRVSAYKKTLAATDPAAAQLAAENGIVTDAGEDLDAVGDPSTVFAAAEDTHVEAPPSPPKAAANKRRKGAATPASAVKETVVAPPANASTPTAATSAAGKKRGRRSKAAEEEPAQPEPPKAEKEKRSRKKRKSEADAA
ncbi:MAG: suppressor of glycerol defect [Chaenotheca gracillima]|nr:MAG: suppressor of glycerol defect [Chaenotheca gracillima]